MGDEWDFCSTKKEDILMTHQGWTSQVKLTREIWVCEVSRDFTDKLRRKVAEKKRLQDGCLSLGKQ
jgi:hypothetical protein